jgi:hypothetical protein
MDLQKLYRRAVETRTLDFLSENESSSFVVRYAQNGTFPRCLIAMEKNNKLSAVPLDEWMHRADEYARREPAKAVASAFGTGFLLNILPLPAIASALTGIVFSLVRPVLLFLGLLKAFEYCTAKSQTPESHE